MTSTYLDPQTLASVGSLELRARWIVEGLMTGMHRSPYHGVSVEFAQHRPYAPGDDIRFLDWKVYARSDKLYLKQFQQETNLDLLLLVDHSGSMGYSSAELTGGRLWRKYDHASSLVAAMTHLALRQQDRVGLVLFSDKLGPTTRLSNAGAHAGAVFDLLENPAHQPTMAEPASLDQAGAGRRTDLSRVFDEALARLHQRSLVVVASDFFDEPATLERGLARMKHRRHDVLLLQVLDPAERTFPFQAGHDFIGLEGEGRVAVEPQALRRSYLAAMEAHLEAVRRVARQFRYDLLLLDTSENVGPALSHFLARRAAAANRGK